jgi:hypothetical protein
VVGEFWLGYFLGLETGEQKFASDIGQFEVVQSLTAEKNRKRGQDRTLPSLGS